MDVSKILEETLSLDMDKVALPESETKDLIKINDSEFAKQYLLLNGAKEKKTPKHKEKEMIKICSLGKSGEQFRTEAFDLIKGVITDNPLRPGFKTGYRTAANLLNKNGYRTFREKKWTDKSVSNFYYNITVRSPQNSNSKQTTNKSKSVKKAPIVSQAKNLDVIKHVINSNLDENIKVYIVSLFVKS